MLKAGILPLVEEALVAVAEDDTSNERLEHRHNLSESLVTPILKLTKHTSFEEHLQA